MKSEQEKMLAGELYDPADPQLEQDRRRAHELCQRLNESSGSAPELRREMIYQLLQVQSDVSIVPPFYCDYGYNIRLGRGVFFNFGCVILDTMPVTIGSHTLFGPNVQIYCPLHPIEADERRSGLEFAKPIMIGNDVWVGGAAIICPGVTIGDRSIIGAGSVVTRDVPPDSFAAGNPARVIRKIEQ